MYNELLKVKQEISELQKKEKLLLRKISYIHTQYVNKVESKNKKTQTNPTGFNANHIINGKFATWLGVKHGTSLRGPEISKLFWKNMKAANLQSDVDGRIFRTNKEISELFGVHESVNKSNDPKDINGFNMRTYQKYIKYALNNHNE
jgi:hypothetical protein